MARWARIPFMHDSRQDARLASSRHGTIRGALLIVALCLVTLPPAPVHGQTAALAERLGLTPVFIPVAEQDDLITELNDGHGDVILGSLAITAERSKRIAFSRPIRFVDQLVVVNAGDSSIQDVDDLAGRTVTVREGSS
jgi:extracellular solute-binding protein (family 3)